MNSNCNTVTLHCCQKTSISSCTESNMCVPHSTASLHLLCHQPLLPHAGSVVPATDSTSIDRRMDRLWQIAGIKMKQTQDEAMVTQEVDEQIMTWLQNGAWCTELLSQ